MFILFWSIKYTTYVKYQFFKVIMIIVDTMFEIIRANREVSALFLIWVLRFFQSLNNHHINCTHNILFTLFQLITFIIYLKYLFLKSYIYCWRSFWKINANRELSASFSVRIKQCLWSVHHHHINHAHNILSACFNWWQILFIFSYWYLEVISFIVAIFFEKSRQTERWVPFFNLDITIF